MPELDLTPPPDPPRKTRRSRGDIEKDWYGQFARWEKSDRAAALKVLTILHETLPDNPRKTDVDDKPDGG